MKDERQIIAFGGLTPAGVDPFYQYVLSQVPRPNPRVGFLPTASADSDASIVRFYQGLSESCCKPSHLKLFGRVADPEQFLAEQDVVLVGGGNLKSMIALWREWGIDEMLRSAWSRGTILGGLSAGATCWFEQALTDSWADRQAATPGLGILSGSCCPHYHSEADRRPEYQRMIGNGEIAPGVAIDDDCGLHFRGTELSAVVTVQSGVGAYSVGVQAGAVVESPLDVTTRLKV